MSEACNGYYSCQFSERHAVISPKLSVCTLERGQEWPVGQFPDNFGDLLGNAYNPVLNRLRLYEFDEFPDIAGIKGSGLGGTSTAIRPEPDVFATWPSALKQPAQIGETKPGSLWNYYKRAEETLEVSSHHTGSKSEKVPSFEEARFRTGPAAAFRLLPRTVAGSQDPAQAQQRLDKDLLGAESAQIPAIITSTHEEKPCPLILT